MNANGCGNFNNYANKLNCCRIKYPLKHSTLVLPLVCVLLPYLFISIKLFFMHDQIKKSGKAKAAEDKFDRTPDLPQEESAMEDDGSPVLDDQDLEENNISPEEVSEEELDAIEWDDDDEEENTSEQGIDKAPGEEKGKGDKVTNKDLKGKQVDADPSAKEGKPLSR
jgi:hypothetical protein